MRTDRSTRRLRQAIGPLLLLIASFSASLGAVELLLRGNVIPNEYHARNEVLGDRAQSGLFLFILGDSFMASIPGGDVVDVLYRELAPHGVGIRNAARAGTGPVQYLEALRREGARHRPDVVVLAYYVGNDLHDVGCKGNLDERLAPPSPPAAWKRSYLVQFADWWLRQRYPGRVFLHSLRRPAPAAPGGPLGPRGPADVRLAGVFPPARRPRALQAVDYEALRRAGIPEADLDSARAGTLNPWIVSLGVKNPNYYRDVLLLRSECAERAWDDTRRVLGLILDEAAALGAEVLPVIFPHSLQVSTAHYALYRSWKINVDDEMLESNRPQELLTAFYRARGLKPLDLLAAFRADTGPLYWDRDEHQNLRGQALSASLIAAEVLARFGDRVR